MADLEKLVDELSALTVMEAAELSKLLEEKWGVSAAAPVAVAAVAGAAVVAKLLLKRKLNLTLFWLPPATRKSTSSKKSVQSPVLA